MERNTFLAIALCISVVLGYDLMIGAPSRAKMQKEAKVVVNKEVKENIVASQPETVKSDVKPTSVVKSGVKSDFSLTKYKVSADSMGGSLHKIHFQSANHPMPIFDVLAIEGYDSENFVPVVVEKNKLVYSYKISSLEILKTFTFKDNVIISSLEILPKDGSKPFIPTFKAFEIDSSRLEDFNKRETMLDEYSVNIAGKVTRKGSAFKFSPKESKVLTGAAQWVGFRDHFHAFVVKPSFETKSVEIKQNTETTLSMYLQPSQTQSKYEFVIYAGEQNKAAMTKVDQSFSKVLAFSSFYPLEIIAQAIYQITIWVQQVVKSWGITIILMSILVYGITYPLTIKSMLSMRKLQQMQPKINALRERFKDDPQKLNMEIVEIYRREKINPFGGCLPMLLQMPFFMAIYQVMWRAYYFQGKSFLWIKDLSQPDRLFVLPFSLPILGNDFNILPIIMGGVMFWQQKLSAQSQVVTDETQAMQQRIMTIFFPIFIAFIFYKFASSLALYFTMFYLFSSLTQWRMTKVK